MYKATVHLFWAQSWRNISQIKVSCNSELTLKKFDAENFLRKTYETWESNKTCEGSDYQSSTSIPRHGYAHHSTSTRQIQKFRRLKLWYFGNKQYDRSKCTHGWCTCDTQAKRSKYGQWPEIHDMSNNTHTSEDLYLVKNAKGCS